MLKALGRIVRGFLWIVHDVHMIVKAPKVSIASKIELLLVYTAYHVLKIDFSKLRVFINVDSIKYRLISYDTLSILSYLEPWMDRYLQVKNGDVFIDVGAHVGKYALKIAKRYPKSLVIAIEPGRLQFDALIDGIKKNKLRNIIPLNIAAWDEETELRLRVYTATGTSSVFDNLGYGRLLRVEEVKARPLDAVIHELSISHVDWVKIDVEGAELHVLRGFKNGIAKFKPKIIIEVSDFNRKEVFKFFKELNYKCKHIPEDESGKYFICTLKQSVE